MDYLRTCLKQKQQLSYDSCSLSLLSRTMKMAPRHTHPQTHPPPDTPMCTPGDSSARELTLGMKINHQSGILQWVKKNFLDTNSFPFYDEIIHFHNQEKD